MELNIANVSLIFTIFGLAIAYFTYTFTVKRENTKEIKEEATQQVISKEEIKFLKNEIEILKNDIKEGQANPTAQAKLEMQLEYIKRGIDEIKSEIKDTKSDVKAQDEKINTLEKTLTEKINSLVEKVARLDESDKSAHKRINEFEQK